MREIKKVSIPQVASLQNNNSSKSAPTWTLSKEIEEYPAGKDLTIEMRFPNFNMWLGLASESSKDIFVKRYLKYEFV